MSNQSATTVSVLYSITNDEITNGDFRDNVTPFSFLDFINNTQADYAPEEYSNFYSSYLSTWHSHQQGSEVEQKVAFKEYYQQFIKEIVVSYTTESEKRFLEKINFNDPVDLDVAIPFFANRLKDIALFYKNKRDEGKFVIDRNRLKGSTTGVEKAIFDNIYNFLFTAEDSLNAQTYDITGITDGLGIEIEEFVDVYGNYFDLPKDDIPDNINSIDTKYYLDPLAIEAVTGQENFLGAIRSFKVNPPAISPEEFDAICNPDNELVEIFNAYEKGGIPMGAFYALKRALISKFLGTDIYYIDNTTVPATSGLLIAANNPAANAMNLQSADTAQIESGDVKLLRDLGLNFTPDNIGLFKLQAENYSYSIDPSVLGNEFVIFPDPDKFGNVSINPVSRYPVYYKFDYSQNVKNVSSGLAAGDPNITNKTTTFESYTTKERNNSQLKDQNDISYKINFTDLYNQGVINKYQTDIFGNEYALFKYEPLKPINIEGSNIVKSLLLNGYNYWDPFAGYGFNYSLTGVNGNTFKSGLTSVTNGMTARPSDELTLYMREFYPYQDLLADTRNLQPFWRDGGAFTYLDGDILPNPLTGLGPGFPAPLCYHYTVLAECTFPLDTILETNQSPLSDIQTEAELDIMTSNIDYNFFFDVRGLLSAGAPYISYDGGYYSDDIYLKNDFNYTDNLTFIDTADPHSATVLSDLSSSLVRITNDERDSLAGKLYVKNGAYSYSLPLSAALGNVVGKYSATVQADLNQSLIDFDLIQNTIFLQTNSNLVIDKIEYTKDKFIKPATSNTLYSINSADRVEAFSNRFYVEETGKVYFARFQTTGAECEEIARNYLTVYPEVYEYSISDNTTKLVFPAVPPLSSSVSDFAINSTLNTTRNYTPQEVHTPNITYNKRNDIFKLTYIINDMNDMTHMIDASFKMVDNILTLINVYKYEDGGITRTTTFGLSTMFGSISAANGSFTRNQATFELTV